MNGIPFKNVYDDFRSFATSLTFWPYRYGTYENVGDALQSNSTFDLSTGTVYDFSNRHFWMEASVGSNIIGGIYMHDDDDWNNYFGVDIAGNGTIEVYVSGSDDPEWSDTYDLVAHRFVGLEESGGTAAIKISADGISWSTIWESASQSWMSDCGGWIGASLNGTPQSGDSITVYRVNYVHPSGLTTYWNYEPGVFNDTPPASVYSDTKLHISIGPGNGVRNVILRSPPVSASVGQGVQISIASNFSTTHTPSAIFGFGLYFRYDSVQYSGVDFGKGFGQSSWVVDYGPDGFVPIDWRIERHWRMMRSTSTQWVIESSSDGATWTQRSAFTADDGPFHLLVTHEYTGFGNAGDSVVDWVIDCLEVTGSPSLHGCTPVRPVGVLAERERPRDFPPRPRISGHFDAWAQAVEEMLRNLPAHSIISTSDGPNVSGQTGKLGDLVTDIGSCATRLWQKHSGSTSTQGWVGFVW